MLKYIMRDKQLQRIPVISMFSSCHSHLCFQGAGFLFIWITFPLLVMSTQDEVSLVVKCLRLGAADYLVKPLRTNELLNLWTHMWRRRQMVRSTILHAKLLRIV